MSTEASLRKKLNVLGPKVKAVVEQGRKIDSDKECLFMFMGLYKSLQRTYDTYIATFEALEDIYETEGKELSDKDWTTLANIERYFHESNAIYEKYMNPTPPQPVQLDQTNILNQGIQPPLNETSILNQSLSLRTHLPRINLPRFDGNYLDWPTFRDTFLSLIHNEAAIPKIEKFHFLLSCLHGSARSLIKSVPLRDDNYDQAWSILFENYDNKRLLATHHLNALLEFKPLPSKPSLQLLKSFLSSVGENIQALKLLKIPDPDEFILFSLAIRCLDPATRRAFEKSNRDSDFPKFDDLVKFIKDECKTLELTETHLSYTNSNSNSVQSISRPKLKTSLMAEGKPVRTKEGNQSKFSSYKPCPECKGAHSLYKCYQFRQAPNHAKWKLLKGWEGCLNCLNANHKLDDCRSEHSCNICHKRHHTWLHLRGDPRQDVSSTGTSTRENVRCDNKNQELQTSPVSLASNSQANDVLLGTALATIKDIKGNFQPVRMVLDCGSQFSFITADCASRLQLKVKPFNLSISGIGQTSLTGNKGIASCLMRTTFGTQQLSTNAVVVECITSSLPHVELPRQLVKTYKYFELADPTFYQPGPIEFLLGADMYFEIIQDKPITIQPTFPKLIPTVFGHVIAGSFQNHTPLNSMRQSLFVNGSDNLNEEMSKFWQIEEIQTKPIQSPLDVYYEQHFMETHSRTSEGKYIARLPFKESLPGDISESKGQALKRFFNLESKLSKNPTLRQKYIHFMEEYINLKHMERTSEKGLYFIPHHGVIKEDDNNSKIRVVFDASATTSVGSLNDHLHIGPKLQRDITEILFNFRSHPIVFTDGMVKMIRQIVLAPQDRKYHHIFWRSDPSHPLEEYHLLTLTYGLSLAPFVALRVIHQLIKDKGEAYPLASSLRTVLSSVARIFDPVGYIFPTVFFDKHLLLSPPKPVTISRLELCGAVLLKRLFISLKPFLSKLPIKKYYWFTNSTIVLQWFTVSVHHIKTFLAHRTINIKKNRLDRRELVKQRIRNHWRRWRTEYLHHLQQRTKWIGKEQNLCVGDLVIVNEANSPSLYWPLARIQKVHAGEDNVIRVVTLRMANGTILTRPVVKIISLQPVTSPENF